MVNQSTLPSLFRAIAKPEIEVGLQQIFADFSESVLSLATNFLQTAVTPVGTHQLEVDFADTVREFARTVVEWCFGAVETQEVDDMPGSIKFRDNSYRRMRDKTNHSQILTTFGNIQLLRATYRRG